MTSRQWATPVLNTCCRARSLRPPVVGCEHLNLAQPEVSSGHDKVARLGHSRGEFGTSTSRLGRDRLADQRAIDRPSAEAVSTDFDVTAKSESKG